MNVRRKKKLLLFVVLSCSIENYSYLLYIMGKTIRRSKKNNRSRKTRTFKKHYMWNTKGKKYLAKTYKQHLKGKKLGHTHTKPKRKTRKGMLEIMILGFYRT